MSGECGPDISSNPERVSRLLSSGGKNGAPLRFQRCRGAGGWHRLSFWVVYRLRICFRYLVPRHGFVFSKRWVTFLSLFHLRGLLGWHPSVLVITSKLGSPGPIFSQFCSRLHFPSRAGYLDL